MGLRARSQRCLETGTDLVDTVMRFADLRKRKRVVRAHDVPVA